MSQETKDRTMLGTVAPVIPTRPPQTGNPPANDRLTEIADELQELGPP